MLVALCRKLYIILLEILCTDGPIDRPGRVYYNIIYRYLLRDCPSNIYIYIYIYIQCAVLRKAKRDIISPCWMKIKMKIFNRTVCCCCLDFESSETVPSLRAVTGQAGR